MHSVTELRVMYHQRLHDIDVAVRQMISLIEQDILNAGAAFLQADEKAAGAVEAGDRVIEECYEQVEQLVMTQFVRQAPVAGELRFLLTVFRILPELISRMTRPRSWPEKAAPAWRASFPIGCAA